MAWEVFMGSEKDEKKKRTIVSRMILAVVMGFICGIAAILIRNAVGGENNAGWRIVNAILFQDITATKGFNGIGLFYIIGQFFMRGLQIAIVPLVLTSLSLALCSLADPKKLGRIAGKTFITYVCFYAVAAFLAGAAAYCVKETGGFDVSLPTKAADAITTMDGYNPLVTLINAIPSNIFTAFSSNNSILAVVVVSIILGLCMTKMGERAEPLKKVLENLGEVVQIWLNFLINRIGPVAIF